MAARSSAGEFATVPVAGNSRESSLVNLLNGSISGELVLSPYPNEPKYPSFPNACVGNPAAYGRVFKSLSGPKSKDTGSGGADILLDFFMLLNLNFADIPTDSLHPAIS